MVSPRMPEGRHALRPVQDLLPCADLDLSCSNTSKWTYIANLCLFRVALSWTSLPCRCVAPPPGPAVDEATPEPALTLSIAAVERDTGLSKDTLRVWERRYGFPAPRRDAIGERAYTLEQVDKLRIVKRLLDAGHRPGRIVPLPFVAKH